MRTLVTVVDCTYVSKTGSERYHSSIYIVEKRGARHATHAENGLKDAPCVFTAQSLAGTEETMVVPEMSVGLIRLFPTYIRRRHSVALAELTMTDRRHRA